MPLSLADSPARATVTEEEQRVAGMSDYVFRILSRDTTALFALRRLYESQVTGGRFTHRATASCWCGWQQVESGRTKTNGGMADRNGEPLHPRQRFAVARGRVYGYRGAFGRVACERISREVGNAARRSRPVARKKHSCASWCRSLRQPQAPPRACQRVSEQMTWRPGSRTSAAAGRARAPAV